MPYGRATSVHSHPLNTALELGTRGAAPKLHGTAVAGQHPLEVVVEEPPHRRDLLAPRVPAGAAEGVEVAAALAPGEVVAGEEERAAIEKDGVAFGVAGRRDHDEVGGELDRVEPRGLALDRGCARADVVAVQHALAAEVLVELGVIG